MMTMDQVKMRSLGHNIAQALAYLLLTLLGVTLMLVGCVRGNYWYAWGGILIQTGANYFGRRDHVIRLEKRVCLLERRLGVNSVTHVIE